MKRKMMYPMLAAMCVFVTAMAYTTFGAESDESTTYIPEGVKIEQFDVGGLSVAQAREVVNEYVDSLKTIQVVFQTSDGSVSTTLGNLGLYWSNEEILEETQGSFSTGSLISQYKAGKDLENNNIELDVQTAVDLDVLTAYMLQEMPALETTPVDAQIQLVNGAFQITEGVNGISIDYNETFSQALLQISDEAESGDDQIVIDVVCTETEPYVTSDVFEGMGDVLGSWTTNYSSSTVDRATNVELGGMSFDGLVILPGEQVSALAVMGPVTAAAGYKPAPTYTVEGTGNEIGGGVCQVSSTLYNAVLRAELQVDYRSPHSKLVTYVEPSMDAMVYWASNADFRFTNNTGHAIYIAASAGNGELTFTIYGVENHTADRQVVYTSEILQESYSDPLYVVIEDPTLDVWNPTDASANASSTLFVIDVYPHPLLISQLRKTVTENGIVISDEIMEGSYKKYKAEQGIIRISPSVKIVSITADGNVVIDINEDYFVEETEEETTVTETESIEESSASKEMESSSEAPAKQETETTETGEAATSETSSDSSEKANKSSMEGSFNADTDGLEDQVADE